MSDLEAIRARDASEGHFREGHDVWPVFQSVYDRRALLALVRDLAAAARKVTCQRCGGTTRLWPDEDDGPPSDCSDCSDLRALLEKQP